MARTEQFVFAHNVVIAGVEHFAALGALKTLQVKNHAGRFAYIGIPFDGLFTVVAREKQSREREESLKEKNKG